MNIQQIIYVLKVYDHQSFTEAAKDLFISQPRLSQAIRDIEDELGFEIFIRSRKGLSGATKRGLEFIDSARILLRQFNALENFKEQNSSSLRISTALITQAQDAFIRLCSENNSDQLLNTDLWFCGCYEASERIKTLESDIGIICILDEKLDDWTYYFRTNDMEYHELSFSGAHITVGAHSPVANKEILLIEDLSGFAYVTEKCTRMKDLALRVHTILDEICPGARTTVSNTDILYRLINASPDGRTFTIDPFPPCKATLEHYGLVSIPLADSFSVHTGYLKLRDSKLTPLGSRFIELLENELSN